MDPDIYLAPAYRIIRLMDLNIPHPEIAARTGFDEAHVRRMETWTKENSNLLDLPPGEFTATEGLVLRYLLHLTSAPDRDEQTQGVFGADEVADIAEAFGAETTLEIAEVVDSLTGKGIFESFLGRRFVDVFSEENEAGDSEAGGQSRDVHTEYPFHVARFHLARSQSPAEPPGIAAAPEMDKNLDLRDNNPLVFRVAKLIDMQLPFHEIAALTGLTEDDVREVVAWTLDAPDLPARVRDVVNATEALVLRGIDSTVGSEPRAEGEGPVTEEEVVRALVGEFGTEATFEIKGAMASLEAKGIAGPRPGRGISDEVVEMLRDDLVPEDPGDLLIHPSAWEGPPSKLVTMLLEPDIFRADARLADALLGPILRKDALRVLLDMDDFWPILEQAMTGALSGFRQNARWPHPGPIYIEFAEVLPENPREYLGVTHGFVITEDSGNDTRGVVIPGIRQGQLRALPVRLNIRTGELMGDAGPIVAGNQMTELIRGLVLFLTDENNEIVEMPLTRRARRRLRQSGTPNPWHVVRRRRTWQAS